MNRRKRFSRRTKNNRKCTRRNTRRNTKRKRRNTRRKVKEVKKYPLRRIRKTERSLRKNRKKYSRRKNNLLGGLLVETKGSEELLPTKELHSHEDFTETNHPSLQKIFDNYVPVTVHYKVGEYSYLSFDKNISASIQAWKNGERDSDSLWRIYSGSLHSDLHRKGIGISILEEELFGLVLDTFDPIGADYDSKSSSKSGSESHDQVIPVEFSDNNWYKHVIINGTTYIVQGPDGGEIEKTGNEVKDENFEIIEGADFRDGKIIFKTEESEVAVEEPEVAVKESEVALKEPEFPMLTHVNYVPVKTNYSQCLGLLLESGVLEDETLRPHSTEIRKIKAPITLTFYVKPGYQKEKTLQLEQRELNFTLENVVSKRNAVVVTDSKNPEKVSVGLVVVSIDGDEITFENAEEKIRLFNEKKGDASIKFRLQDPEKDYGYDHPKIGFPMEGVHHVDDPYAFGNLLEASKQLETFSHENEGVSELLRKGSRAQKEFVADEDEWVVQTVDEA